MRVVFALSLWILTRARPQHDNEIRSMKPNDLMIDLTE